MYTVTKTYLFFSTERVTAVCGKQTEIGKVVPRTAIEAEILYQALYVHVQRLKTSLTKCQTRYCIEPRPSVDDCRIVRFWGAAIKSVHPCTDLIARFAQQNVLLLRTTDIRVGTEKKILREQSRSGKKIGAVRQRKMHIKRVFG